MIGKTNCKAVSILPCEIINITLTTNQSTHNDLVGTTFTVNYGSYIKDYVWEGSQMTIEVPAYVQYVIEFGNVNGYKAPDAIINTAINGNSRNITGTYQTCLLSIAITDNQSSYNDISGAKATIVGTTINTTIVNGDTVKIPIDETVTITGTEISGYLKPSTTYTAINTSKTITLNYTTEILTVNVSGVSSGYTVYVKKSDGTVLGSQTTASKVYKIPSNTQYYVQASAVSSYTTPSNSTTYTSASTSNANRSVSMNYVLATETVTVKCSGLSSGFTLTVINATTGATIGSQTTTSKSYSIPAGTKYYVTASAVSGYNKPSNSATYTAVASGTRTVTITYKVHEGTQNPSNGVWIQDIDGYYHTESGWSGSYIPNGIAVITDTCSFIIALQDAAVCMWGGYGKVMAGASNLANASESYNGKSLTNSIISNLNGYNDGYTTGAPAAEYCANFVFPNGKKGYLGASGEWNIAVHNTTSIESALDVCGGSPMGARYWTSTSYSGTKESWYAWWSNTHISQTYRYNNYNVRAFCSL